MVCSHIAGRLSGNLHHSRGTNRMNVSHTASFTNVSTPARKDPGGINGKGLSTGLRLSTPWRRCQCAAAGGGSDSWQSRRLQKLRQKQGGSVGPAPPPPRSVAGKSRRSTPPKQQTEVREQGWQQELAKRQEKAAGAADVTPSLPSPTVRKSSPRPLPSAASVSPPAAEQRSAATSISSSADASSQAPEAKEDEDNVPERLKRSAVPKPFRLPPSGVRLTASRGSRGPVLRSSKRRNRGPASVMDVYEKAKARHKEETGTVAAHISERSAAPVSGRPGVKSKAARASTARREARRGDAGTGSSSSSLFEESLMGSVNMALEEMLHVRGGGVNRACLGRGELHWYKLCCKEGRQNEAVRELQSAGLAAVVVPLRKERSTSASGRATWRKVNYEHGSAVLVLARLTMGHIKAVEGAKTLSHSPAPCWWHHVAYSSVRTQRQGHQQDAPEPLILPRPMTKDELKEVASFESSGPASRKEPTDFASREKDRLKVNGHYVDPC